MTTPASERRPPGRAQLKGQLKSETKEIRSGDLGRNHLAGAFPAAFHLFHS